MIKDEFFEQGGFEAKRAGKTSGRRVALVVGCSHVTANKVIEELENPPELEKFKEWKLTWNRDLTEDQRMAFVRENAADLQDMLAGM
jgi:hypothetical protein